MTHSQNLRDFFADKSENNISVYLAHCKKMGYKVMQQKGVVIFGYGFIDRGFPARVYFLPGEINTKQTLDEFITKKLTDVEIPMFEIYIDHMLWRSPELPEFLNTLESRNVIVGGRYNEKSKAVYCSILFNMFYGKSISVPASTDIEQSTITFNDKVYHVNVQQLSDKKGLPVFVE